MPSRLDLHNTLLQYCQNAYFQPPPGFMLRYPCIVYRKADINFLKANDHIYLDKQWWMLTVITNDPDSTLSRDLCDAFHIALIMDTFRKDNLYHTNVKILV